MIRIHAFDFDGTLTHKDSFTDFLRFIVGRKKFLLFILSQWRLFLSFAMTRDRGLIKSRLIYSLLGNIPKSEFLGLVQRYSRQNAYGLLRPDALEHWNALKKNGEKCVIVTASPDIIVHALMRAYNPDEVIGSQLDFDENDCLIPRLNGHNCRGPQKVLRLKKHFGDDVIILSAYGDTKGDRELLLAASSRYYKRFKKKPSYL